MKKYIIHLGKWYKPDSPAIAPMVEYLNRNQWAWNWADEFSLSGSLGSWVYSMTLVVSDEDLTIIKLVFGDLIDDIELEGIYFDDTGEKVPRED